MTDKTTVTATRPLLTSIAAQLFVTDIVASCEFYAGKLGFAADFVYGEPPFYAQLSRDDARLALRHVDERVFAGDIREREALLSASITLAALDEIERLFRAFQGAGVPFHQEMRREPWGAMTFVVRDPDGNLILFASPAD